jgi:LysM repeat protein
MRHRSPARFLAPLALILATLAVYLIVKPAADDSPATSGSTSTSTSTSSSTTAAKKPKQPAAKKQPKTVKTYTVQSGDTLSAIAEETGVTVEDLLLFNPGLDANSMGVGQKLKLAG